MKKILVILNGIHLSNNVLASAVNLGKSTEVFLHAIFLNDESHSSEYRYFFPNDLSTTENNLTGKSFAEEDREILETNIKLFEDECAVAGIKSEVETRRHLAITDLVRQSDFYDLLLIDAKTNLWDYPLAELLAEAHCPVLLTGSKMETPGTILLAYDGSASSSYALKMFTYLFPEWNSRPVELVYIASGDERALPHEREVTSWLSLHYGQVEQQVLTGPVHQALVEFINAQPEPPFLVMGAFGRKAISRMFHRSLSKAVIKQTNASVFITHK